MHEPGRYFDGIALAVAGPQFQLAIVLPPSVVPTSAVVPVWIGASLIEFAVADVLPPRLAWLPTIVITPLALTEPEVTYLVAVSYTHLTLPTSDLV